MNKKTLLKINWSYLLIGFITTVLLIAFSLQDDHEINTLGSIVFFSIMFLAGFIGINIQYKDK